MCPERFIWILFSAVFAIFVAAGALSSGVAETVSTEETLFLKKNAAGVTSANDAEAVRRFFYDRNDYEGSLIWFRSLNDEKQSIGYQCMAIITTRMWDGRKRLVNELAFQMNSETDVFLTDDEQVVIYDGEIRTAGYVKEDIAIDAVAKGLAETVESTPFGQGIKNVERALRKYFITEYSREKSESSARLYLPGELTESRMRAEKDYRVSMATFFYTSPDSPAGACFTEMAVDYYDIHTNTRFDYFKQKAEINFRLKNLYDCPNAEAGFSLMNFRDHETVYLFTVSREF